MHTTMRKCPLWTADIIADVDDPRRLYRRVTDDIATLILDGTLPAGTRLPSARDLAAIYRVSTMTAQRHARAAAMPVHLCHHRQRHLRTPEARTVAVLLHAMRHPTVARHQDLAAAEIGNAGKRRRRTAACELLTHTQSTAGRYWNTSSDCCQPHPNRSNRYFASGDTRGCEGPPRSDGTAPVIETHIRDGFPYGDPSRRPHACAVRAAHSDGPCRQFRAVALD
jgi:hypothetical protein